LNAKAPVPTVLSDAGSLTEGERRHLAEEWLKRNMDVLFSYADYNPSFAEELCKKVADRYGQDDHLSALLLKRLRTDRRGKPTARRKTWTRGRYFVLLLHYQALLKFGENRDDVLTKLAEQEKLTGDNKSKKIEQKITQARKMISQDELPAFCRSPSPLRKKGG